MESKIEKSVKIRIDAEQMNDLRQEIDAIQDLLYKDDIELFENKYPSLFELWSALG